MSHTPASRSTRLLDPLPDIPYRFISSLKGAPMKKLAFLRWFIEPHPWMVFSIIFTYLELFGVYRLFSPEHQQRILSALCGIKHPTIWIFPIIFLAITASAVRRILFNGESAYRGLGRAEITDDWPTRKTTYVQGCIWFLYGLGQLYLSIAGIVVGIVSILKWTSIGITEALRFILITLPTLIAGTAVTSCRTPRQRRA